MPPSLSARFFVPCSSPFEIGGEGADYLFGQSGSDTASYAATATGIVLRLDGVAGSGGAAGDILNSIENVTGSAYADTIFMSAAANRIIGGDGTDTVTYETSAKGVLARLAGTSSSGAAGDVITGVENLTGSNYGDALAGADDGNVLDGLSGNDTLFGGGGDDTLIGGEGADYLFGQGGSDVFLFADGFGNDIITGFDALNDAEKIDLSGVNAITDFADLTNLGNPHMSQVGADVMIDDFAGNTILVENVLLTDMNEPDFVF